MEPTRSSVPIVAGAAMAVVALAVLAVGALLVGLHATQRDGDGYFTSGHNHLSTPARALVSNGLDIHTGDAPDWALDRGRLGTLRVTASATNAKPVFVGIARTTQVNGYLRNVDRGEITDFELSPFSVDYTRRRGAAVPARPASRSIWAASAMGRGEQVLEWPVKKGDWSVVIMNADGSAGVATNFSVGAKLGVILWLGLGILAVGAVLLASGVVAVIAGRRASPADRSTPLNSFAQNVS